MVSGVGFVISPAGILKIISLLCMIIGGLIFVTAGDCNESQFWSIAYIITTTASATLAFLSYALYALALIKSTTGLKVQHIAEITVAYVTFLLLMIVSIVMMTQCTSKKLPIDHIPEPLTISGAILFAIGGTLLFLDWRSKERIDDIQMNIPRSPRQRNNPNLSRKSILV